MIFLVPNLFYMFGKIFASFILIAVLYIFGVFFAPNLSDSVAEKLGIMSVNTTLRQLKNGADTTSETLLQIKDASGIISSARDAVHKTVEGVETTKQMINQKVQQGERVVDSVKKTQESFTELQNNVSELTSFSGSVTLSGAQK